MRAASPTGPGTPLPEVPRLRDGLHHGEPHEDGADGVVLSVVRQATDAVVTVAQDLNPQLVVFLKGPGRGCGPESLLGREAWERKQRKDRWEESVGVWEGRAQAARVALPLESRVRVRVLTAASLSKRAKSSLSSLTSSCALQAEDSCVKPTMSANRMLRGGGEGGGRSDSGHTPATTASSCSQPTAPGITAGAGASSSPKAVSPRQLQGESRALTFSLSCGLPPSLHCLAPASG